MKKQEMTKLWIDNRFVAVTLVSPVTQKVVRHKTVATDGYNALVIEVSGEQSGSGMYEIRGDEKLLQSYPVETVLDTKLFDGLSAVRITGTSKGKGFQ